MTASTQKPIQLNASLPFFAFLLMIALFSSCSRQVLLKANFVNNPMGQTPLTNQEVGQVAAIAPVTNTVVDKVAGIPGNFVKITRVNNPAIVAGLQGTVTENKGDGVYVFSTSLYIPTNAEVVTVQFEPIGQSTTGFTNFLHIDFLKNNKIKIDDDESTIFGSFPRNQLFILRVTLNINATPSADIVLSGAGASGQAHKDITLAPLKIFAHQFGAVRLWMGTPWVGTFYATNILVEKN